MFYVDVLRSLGVVLLDMVEQRVGALQVEPALVLAAKFDGTFLQDGLDVDCAADGVVLAFDGADLAQSVDGGQGIASGGQLGLGLDEIHLCQAEHHDVAIRSVVGGIVCVVDVVEELLDAGI